MNVAVPDIMSAIGWTLVHFLWQGALIGFATAVALTLLRNARPQLRYLVACAGLLACVAWPAVELCQQLAGAGAPAGTLDSSARTVMTGAAQAAPDLLAYLQAHMQWLVGAWASCALALALRMGVGLVWLGNAGRGNAVDVHWQARVDRMAERFGITRGIRLRVVDSLASPITAGWWRPVVLVPAALVSGMPADLLEALLAHELAHVKRHDYLVNLAQNVVEALLFYHPAVWWISGRIRAEREQIADDLAAGQLGERRRLARALSELEKLQFAPHRLAQAANGGDLFARIQRLVRPDAQALNWKAAVPVLGLAVACLSACSTIQRDAAPAAQPSMGSPQPVVDVQPVQPAPPPETAMRAATGQQPARADRPAPAEQAPAAEPQAAAPESMKPTQAIVDFRSCDKPRWPAADLEAGHEGTVTMAFLVSEDGTVLNTRVTRSSGFRDLDNSAREAIAQCHFRPATVRGKPVMAWTSIQYVWLQHEPAKEAP